jgi:hypothetical protein
MFAHAIRRRSTRCFAILEASVISLTVTYTIEYAGAMKVTRPQGMKKFAFRKEVKDLS